jgi:selenide, water dikinase
LQKRRSIVVVRKGKSSQFTSFLLPPFFIYLSFLFSSCRLEQMLRELDLGDGHNLGTRDGRIALDCSVRETRQGHYVISTTDMFFPLVESPYMQGRIGAANVLSDLYAEGVECADFVLMLVAACRDMPPEVRTICTREMVRGFRDACREAETVVTGGQTILNPWPIIGGVATSVVSKGEFVASDGAKAGDVVVLTKPLGTQVAVNVHQWRGKKNASWQKCVDLNIITEEDAEDMMHAAVCSMARLNRHAARLMLRHKAHACTDVTGFGILGHAQNLSSNQAEAVALEIHTLPCIRGTPTVNNQVHNFRLLLGYSAETSGGLMICMSEENVAEFQAELERVDGQPSWVIGRVVDDETRTARIVEDVNVIEV